MKMKRPKAGRNVNEWQISGVEGKTSRIDRKVSGANVIPHLAETWHVKDYESDFLFP